MTDFVMLPLVGRLLAPVAGRAIPGLLGRITLGWRVSRAVSLSAKSKGWRVSRRALRRALVTKDATRELLESERQSYPALVTAARAGLLEPRTPEVVAELVLNIAEEFVKALPDREAIQTHTTREAAKLYKTLRDAVETIQDDIHVLSLPGRGTRDGELEGHREPNGRISNLHRIPRSAGLILRDDLHAECQAVLAETRLLVLTGPHGCGKSVTAGQLAFASDMTVRWWIDGHSQESIQLGVEALARALGRTGRGSAVDDVRELLANDAMALLIIDGVGDARSLYGLIPGTMKGSVIATTTDVLVGEASSRVSVGPLKPAQGRTLFESLAYGGSGSQIDGAGELVEALGQLPLAIRQAAAYVRATGVSPTDLRERLLRSPRRVLGAHAPTDYPSTTLGVHDLAREAVVWEEPDAAAVLTLIAMCGRGGVTRQLLDVASSAPDATLRVDRALAALSRTGLIQSSPDRVACHSTTALFELESGQPRLRRSLARRAILLAQRLDKEGVLQNVDVVLQALGDLFPHAQYESEEALAERMWMLLLSVGGGHPLSVVLHSSAVQDLVRNDPKHADLLLEMLLLEAEQHVTLGFPRRALALADEALSRVDGSDSSTHELRALALASLCHSQLGGRDEAIDLARRAAAAESDPDARNLHDAFAARLAAQRRNPAVQADQMLSIRERLTPGTPEWALQSALAGRALVDAGDPEQALDLTMGALALDRAIFGEVALPVARDMNDIGHALIALQRLDDAEAWLRNSIDIYNELGGGSHSHAGLPKLHLGRLQFERSRAADAGERESLRAAAVVLLTEALALNSEEGAEGSELAATFVALGDALLLSPDLAERSRARHYFERAEEIDLREFKEGSVEVLIDRLRIAGAHFALSDYDSAREIVESLKSALSHSPDLPLLQADALIMRFLLELAVPEPNLARVQGLARRLVRLENDSSHPPGVAAAIAGHIDSVPMDVREIAGLADVE